MLDKHRAWYRALVSKHAAEAGEEGFTLIELMVVVLIIAILMAIAIPAFLGTKNTAENSAPQQDITNVITDAASIYANSQDYVGICGGAGGTLANTETNILIEAPGTAPAPGTNQVTVACPAATGADEALLLTTQSKTGDCFMAFVDTVHGTFYGVDNTEKGTAAACPAGDIPANSTAGAAPTPAASTHVIWASTGFNATTIVAAE